MGRKYDEIISFENLYKALKKCCNGIRWKDSTVNYEQNAIKNTLKLRESLLNGKYKISEYQKFTIYEPKKRDIVATRIKDRQFQRSLCDNGFYEDITKSFIADNCACMKGRGVDYTLKRITKHLRKYHQKNGNKGWVLKCDIHHYFQSIRHDVAKEAVRKRVDDEMICYRVNEIIDSFDDIGIGLGSQVSQLIALAILDDLDHFVKEVLRVKHYVRYMDDFILIHEDKEFLKYCKGEIEKKLDEIGLKLNKKTALQPLEKGFKMLQWKFILTESGKIIKKMDKKKIVKQRKRLKKLIEGEEAGRNHVKASKESLTAFLANAERGDTYFQREKIIEFYQEERSRNHGQRNDEKTQ